MRVVSQLSGVVQSRQGRHTLSIGAAGTGATGAARRAGALSKSPSCRGSPSFQLLTLAVPSLEGAAQIDVGEAEAAVDPDAAADPPGAE